MELTKLLETKTPDLTIRVDFKGFELELAYIDKPGLEALVGRAKTRTWDRKHQMAETIDEKKLVRGLATLIKGWHGLSLGHLATLLPIDIIDRDADAPVSFSAENAAVLIAQVYGLDDFIIDTVTDLQIFRAEKMETEKKN